MNTPHELQHVLANFVRQVDDHGWLKQNPRTELPYEEVADLLAKHLTDEGFGIIKL